MSPPGVGNGTSIGFDGQPEYLVTGAAGFIGSHLCDRLLKDGATVWGIDNFDDFYDPDRKRENLRSALAHDSMHLVEGDVRDSVLLDGLMTDVAFDAVIHLAARPGAEISLDNPGPTFDVNVRGTLNLLEAVRRNRIACFLYASSDDVYGDVDSNPRREDMPADRPLSPYAASKRAAEMLCHVYHHLHGLTVHCLRLSPVFGPRERPDLAVHECVRLLEDGGPPSGLTEPPEGSNYVYVDDAVEGLCLSLERASRRDGDGPEFQVINLGGNEAVEFGDLMKRVASALGSTAEIKDLPEDRADRPTSPISIERGKELLNYSPSTSLDEGLTQFVSWLRSQDDTGDDPAGLAASSFRVRPRDGPATDA